MDHKNVEMMVFTIIVGVCRPSIQRLNIKATQLNVNDRMRGHILFNPFIAGTVFTRQNPNL